MSDLSYLKDFEMYSEWMSQQGYDGQVWEDRLIKPLDKYEHPPRGVTYTQAQDLVEYINTIAKQTSGLSLLSGQVHLWVNYAAPEGGTRYAPVEAFPAMMAEGWQGLHDFAVMLASGEQYAGPGIHSARLLLNSLKPAPQNVVTDLLAPHGSVNAGMLSYYPAGDAAVKVFKTAWDAAIKSPNE